MLGLAASVAGLEDQMAQEVDRIGQGVDEESLVQVADTSQAEEIRTAYQGSHMVGILGVLDLVDRSAGWVEDSCKEKGAVAGSVQDPAVVVAGWGNAGVVENSGFAEAAQSGSAGEVAGSGLVELQKESRLGEHSVDETWLATCSRKEQLRSSSYEERM